MVQAHDQEFTHTYVVHYPEHGPRESDPHYKDFHAYKAKRKREGTYHCDFAVQYYGGDFSECSGQIECHHSHIEFAMQNWVSGNPEDISYLEKAYPGVTSMGVGAWVESAENLTLLCTAHHRGHGGVHNASYSDYEAEKFIKNLIS